MIEGSTTTDNNCEDKRKAISGDGNKREERNADNGSRENRVRGREPMTEKEEKELVKTTVTNE